jgi:chromosome partitioning protein
VLLVDLDPQGNATMGSGIDKREIEDTICDVLLGEAERPHPQAHRGRVRPAAGQHRADRGRNQPDGARGREQRLKRALAPMRAHYDYILIDCPPALSLLTLNALTAADSIIVPMQCEYYALEGISACSIPSRRSRPGSIRSSRSKACCAPCSTCATTSPTRCRRN